jgi:hypothetical protein
VLGNTDSWWPGEIHFQVEHLYVYSSPDPQPALSYCLNAGYQAACPPGSLATCPATSCKEILVDGHSMGDGLYWLDPDGSGAFQISCDMTTDGGGWTLAMKLDDSSDVFEYDAVYWENPDLLNPSDNLPNASVAGTNAKFESFNSVGGDTLRLEFINPAWNIHYYDLLGMTPLTLFRGPEDMVAGSEADACHGPLLDATPDYSSSLFSFQQGHQFFGVNGTDSGSYDSRMRFGYGSNDETDTPWGPRMGVGPFNGNSATMTSVFWYAPSDCNDCGGCYGTGPAAGNTAANLWVR